MVYFYKRRTGLPPCRAPPPHPPSPFTVQRRSFTPEEQREADAVVSSVHRWSGDAAVRRTAAGHVIGIDRPVLLFVFLEDVCEVSGSCWLFIFDPVTGCCSYAVSKTYETAATLGQISVVKDILISVGLN